ncbi:MAG: helix-turn-helix domain-containing protein [Balneolaceae bacterium]|nr:helix-turn-helix domain-containing protein [Balneolaceae bacterium]
MQAYIPTKQDLREFIRQAVKEEFKTSIPQAIKTANRKEWLTTDEVMEILQCSRRHVQHLRDSGKLPFTQHRRTVRYRYNDVEHFLNKGFVEAEI